MAGTTLEKLLERIRDGEASTSQIAEARELARHDGRLPEDLRDEVLDPDAGSADLEAEAVGLLALLGNDDFGALLKEALYDELDIADDVMAAISASGPPVAEAVRDEAGEIEITAQTLEDLGDLGIPVREAVLAEAGRIDIANAVLCELGAESMNVAGAVSAEAGQIDISAQVFGEIDGESFAIREAVLAEAGRIDIASAVFAELGGELASLADAVRSEAGDIDISAQVFGEIGGESFAIREAVLAEAGEAPDVWNGVIDEIGARETIVPEAPVIAFPDATVSPAASGAYPAPANNNRRWGYAFGALLMAAIALIVVGLTQVVPSDTSDEVPEIAVIVPDTELVFASAADVIVENLETGDDVMVMQMMGDDGAMILWVDEGEVL